MNSLFVDILGALIGLVTVLLMLSMVVTALVQATQGVLRLRSRNLLFGLTSVIAKHDGIDREEAKEKAYEIINAKSAPMFQGLIDPKGNIGKKIGPQVSWITTEELNIILDECHTILDADVRREIVKGWSTVHNALSKRFLRNIRIWTIVWAAVVAVYFQISTPALFSRLLNAPDSQENIAFPKLEDIRKALDANQDLSYEKVSAKALKDLAENYPEYRKALNQIGAPTADGNNIRHQLATVLKDDPAQSRIIYEYEERLAEQYQKQLDDALDDYDRLNRSLGRMNIEPWSGGWDYYVRGGELRWKNSIGVLITLILITFGAPFWFNVLCKFINLRDTLKPHGKDTQSSVTEDTHATTVQSVTPSVEHDATKQGEGDLSEASELSNENRPAKTKASKKKVAKKAMTVKKTREQ